jgi:HAD superfamily hydrolase (TIGR01509 family)
MDGVVIDSERYNDKLMANILKKLGKKHDVTTIKPKLVGIPDIDGMNLLVKYYNLPMSGLEFDNLRKSKRSYMYKNKIPYMPGFRLFYTKLQKRYGADAAIVTSCNKEYFDLVDARLKITDLFKRHIYRAEMVKNHKPAPDIFLLGAKKLGVLASDCVAFEDAPSGIVAALRSGARTIAITTTFDKKILLKHASIIMGRKVNEKELLFVPDFKKASIDRIFRYIDSK